MANSQVERRFVSLRSCAKLRDGGFNLQTFAEAGFTFDEAVDLASGEEDRLTCEYCPCTLASWILEDDPWKEHAKAVPRCVHVMAVKGLDYIKTVMMEPERDRDVRYQPSYTQQENLDHFNKGKFPSDMKGEIHLRPDRYAVSVSGSNGPLNIDHQCAYLHHSVTPYVTHGGIACKRPMLPRMEEESDRMKSFEVLPPDNWLRQNCRELAEAGFFYTGKEEQTCCYYCGIYFKGWKMFDIPMVEHARHVCSCLHVILTKGEEWVQEVPTTTSNSGVRHSVGGMFYEPANLVDTFLCCGVQVRAQPNCTACPRCNRRFRPNRRR